MRLLAALEAQSDRDFEVVVAIDGGTDDTERHLEGARCTFPLRWLNTECRGYGLALARNLGILDARGRAVVIVDDDSVPDPEFVEAHLGSVASGVITGGPRRPSRAGHARMQWKLERLLELPPATPFTLEVLHDEWPDVYLIENNICLLRDDWIRIGLFSERLRLYGYIGQEFFARAKHLGFRYQVDPRAGIVHHSELEGDNGVTRRRKDLQTLLARLLRPALMTPRHFAAQVARAEALAVGRPLPSMPAFLPAAAARLPAVLLRRLWRPTRVGS